MDVHYGDGDLWSVGGTHSLAGDSTGDAPSEVHGGSLGRVCKVIVETMAFC